MNNRFIQIHTLHSYPAALLNRDDSGLAKRMPFGDVERTRISSQCLKFHWRNTNDEYSLSNVQGAAGSVLSRNIVVREVVGPLRGNSAFEEDVLDAVEEAFNVGVYGEKGNTQKGRQPLLLGQPEVNYLRKKARDICNKYPDDVASAKDATELLFKSGKKNEESDNFKAFRQATELNGGLISALFGRMVTSDPEANIDAPIYVEHAMTVHKAEQEMDLFTVIDDLKNEDDDSGAAHLNETQLTSGLYYGYVVVDVEGLVSNLSGSRELAGEVLKHLVHIIATVSPGAKRGSTAPFAFAEMMLVETGSRQPRTLVNAFRNPTTAQVEDAVNTMSDYLTKVDNCYGSHEDRRVMSIEDFELPNAERSNCDDIAEWVSEIVNGENGISFFIRN